jgi:hypothetical protein
MSETVVFLGAGASYALGLPLTSEILPRLISGVENPATLLTDDPDGRTRLLEGLGRLLPGLAQTRRENPNGWPALLPLITDVLSTIDHLARQASAAAPNLGPADLPRLRRLLERAIFELLVRQDQNAAETVLRTEGLPDSVRKEWTDTYAAGSFKPRDPRYEADLTAIVDWLKPSGANRVTILSTNYDIEVEQELYDRMRYDEVFETVDFDTSVRRPDKPEICARRAGAKYSVLKLHGSLNWLRCDLCDNVYINPAGPIAYLAFLLDDELSADTPHAKMRRQLRKDFANVCHCGYGPLSHVIVAPSFVRDVRDPILLEVWRAALDALRRADTWIIVGYSLPPEDLAIRSMLLRASASRKDHQPPLRVVVVQGSRKEPELSRYRLLLPDHEFFPGALDREGGLVSYIQKAHAAGV